MISPIDEAVQNLFRDSVFAPALNRPVDQVLADLGLGPLPHLPAEIPMPELPPLPVLDLTLLMKPLTDLASSFGTGRFAPETGSDPTQVFAQVAAALQNSLQVGAAAIQAAMALWQGLSATGAADKARQAQRDGAAIAGQSAETAAGTASAAGSVFTGATTIAAIIARYMATIAAAGPFLLTGAGQVFLLAATTETLAEATAVTAKTRAELSVESMKMLAIGQKIPVTDAPGGVDSTALITQLMQLVPTLVGAVSAGAQSMDGAHRALDPVTPPAETRKSEPGRHAGAGVPAPGGVVIGGLGAPAPPQAPQAPHPGTRAVGGSPVPAPPTTAGAAPAVGNGSRAGGGVVPMGGGIPAAGLARGGDPSTADSPRTQLITAGHGDEVVGEIAGVALPVVGVGAVDHIPHPSSGESPDKALTL
ncbi:hypothetical protein [Nocardia carnea]|uniref:hypothetical protein n=1 Tax=Nocardia carnea TaxID=37328 RepID=UPI002453DEAD|nr:hypothetical protein [Nocardia carnea]